MNQPPLEDGLPSKTLVEPPGLGWKAGVPAAFRGVFQRLHRRMKQQNRGSIDAELGGRLFEKDVQGHAQIDGAGDRRVNGVERGEMLELAVNLLFGALAFGDVVEDRNKVSFLRTVNRNG